MLNSYIENRPVRTYYHTCDVCGVEIVLHMNEQGKRGFKYYYEDDISGRAQGEFCSVKCYMLKQFECNDIKNYLEFTAFWDKEYNKNKQTVEELVDGIYNYANKQYKPMMFDYIKEHYEEFYLKIFNDKDQNDS